MKTHLANSLNGAIFSEDRCHRYALWRQWSSSLDVILFVALNPSTADESIDDPTIRRCRGYAKAWSASGFIVVNLFAFRTTFPEDLIASNEPIGKDNDRWLSVCSEISRFTLVCWGNHGRHLNRAKKVLPLLQRTHALKTNKGGEPCHPLYLAANLQPYPFPTTGGSS